jgi:hypothetical protein
MNSQIIRAPLPEVIDSTQMVAFRSCPEKFNLEFVRGRRPPGISIDLHAGACFASGIEAVRRGVWEMGLDLEAALARAHLLFLREWGDFEIPEWKKTGKTLENMWEAIVQYFRRWPPRTDYIQPYFSPSGKGTFEYTFAIPLEGDDWPLHPSGSPFLFGGRFDTLGKYEERPCVLDEKTSGKTAGTNWADQWDLRNQFMGYVWACQQAGYDLDTVIVRGISVLKTKEPSFSEAIKVYSKHMIAKWYEQFRRDLWRIRRSWDEGYFDYNFGDTCTAYGNCIFMQTCQSTPETKESWLGEFAVRHWNPLLKNPAGEGGNA